MKYIYPKFSNYELPGLRLGGPGLGNLLFIYARAWVLAQKYHLKLINPTWTSIKVGPWLRNEKDKRFYHNLFTNNTHMTAGIEKVRLLLGHRKYTVSTIGENSIASLPDGSILLYDHFKMSFDDLLPYQRGLVNDIWANLTPLSARPATENFNRTVAVHVRLGDFSVNNTQLQQGANNTRIPLAWYVGVVKQLRQLLGSSIQYAIFSDGTDAELAPLLQLPCVKREFYGNSMADIYALSRAPLMIASGSSFSLWARFLGQHSSISYPNQQKGKVLLDTKNNFEIEHDISDKFNHRIETSIRNLYMRNKK